MKVRRKKVFRAYNQQWVVVRGRDAQWSFLRGHKLDGKLGRLDPDRAFYAPAIPYERFIMNRLFDQGFGCY